MPSGYLDIKQKTQADIVPDIPQPITTFHKTIKYDNNAKTLLVYNYPKSQVFNFNEDDNIVSLENINKDLENKTSFTDYEEENKTLNMSDRGYSEESGGGIVIPKISTREVEIGGGSQTVNCYYYIFTLDVLQASKNIIKFGYCCNDNYGKDFPIFILFGNTSTGREVRFYPGKEGMYEFQPEYWDNEKIYPEKISQIIIPIGPDYNSPFSFVLDYVTA